MMRKWLAGKLFELAAWLDWDAVVIPPKRKRGRPLGSKNKAGRPTPVANACTGATPFDEAVKLAFPRESKPKVQP